MIWQKKETKLRVAGNRAYKETGERGFPKNVTCTVLLQEKYMKYQN